MDYTLTSKHTQVIICYALLVGRATIVYGGFRIQWSSINKNQKFHFLYAHYNANNISNALKKHDSMPVNAYFTTQIK